MRKTWKKLLSVLLALSMVLSLTVTGWAAEETGGTKLELQDLDPATLQIPVVGQTEEEEESAAPAYGPNEMVRVSIFLTKAATIDAGFSTQNFAGNRGAVAYRQILRSQQDQMTTAISRKLGTPLDVKWNLTLAVNAISANVRYGDIATIEAMPGVKSVELENRYDLTESGAADRPDTAITTEEMVGATETWANGYTGAGTRIAIIDTGLDDAHLSFDAKAFDHALAEDAQKAGKTVADYNLLTADEIAGVSSQLHSAANADQAYLNTKVPYAFNYVDGNYVTNHLEDEEGEHGSHVAGIAAANRYVPDGEGGFADAASTVFAVGVAPEAQLMVMKVFGAGGGAYDSDYMAAIEDAIVLNADSINLSLGSGNAGFTFSGSYQEVMDNLAKSESVVTISSGNNSDYGTNQQQAQYYSLFQPDVNFQTGGSPGSFTNSLAVASADNVGQTGTPVIFNGEQVAFYAETSSKGAPMVSAAGNYEYVYIDGVGDTKEYETVNPTVSLEGKVVIVNRGSLSFYEKGNNLIPFKPAALMVANNQPGTINMALDDYTGSFPMVSFTLADAETLKAASQKQTVGDYTVYTGKVEIAANMQTGVSASREEAGLSSFSSWGVPGSLVMKPEITAPGGGIYSVNGAHIDEKTHQLVAGDNASYENMSGTSMAAPHAAGMAALVAQYIRENDLAKKTGLTARQLAQSLLMSTATPMVDADGYYLSVLGQGAGLTSAAYATQAKTYLTMDEKATASAADGKVKVELGDDPDRTGSYSYMFTINNMSDQDLEYELNTDMFTQLAYYGYLWPDTDFLDADVNYVIQTEETAHDVDVDGDTDEDDAQAILDKITGAYPEDADFDEEAADLDGDGTYTSYDAYLLLKLVEELTVEDTLLVPANGSATVSVSIKLNDTATLDEDYVNGAYVEGYTYVTCVSETDDGEALDVEHSIPILGFYGDWSDATMFDRNTGINYAYELDYPAYFADYEGVGGLRVRYPGYGTSVYMINPYVVEDEYPEGRMFINSQTALTGFGYTLIRNAGSVMAAITDENGQIIANGALKNNAYAAYYYPANSAWVVNLTNTPLDVTAESLGLKEGDSFTAGLYAATEYTAMQLNGGTAGTLDEDQMKDLISSGALDDENMMVTLTVDNTAPEILSVELSEDKTSLTVTAKDDNYVAAVVLMDPAGVETYDVIAPEQSGKGETVEVTFEGLDAETMGNGVCVFVGDYAHNETARLAMLEDGPIYDKILVWKLTDTMENGKEYIITNSKEPGVAQAMTSNGLLYPLSSKPVNVISDEKGTYIAADSVKDTFTWIPDGNDDEGYLLTNKDDGGTLGYLGRIYNLSAEYSAYYAPFVYENNKMVFAGDTDGLCFLPADANVSYDRYDYSADPDEVYLFTPEYVQGDELDPDNASAVIVTPDKATLMVGAQSQIQLSAEVKPIFVENKDVTWTSSNEDVATVDANGLVTAVGLGKTLITATSVQSPDVKGYSEVSVVEADYDLNATIWDEEGEVWFTTFNPMTLPNFTRLHDTSLNQRVCSAAYGADGTLYAATFDGDEEKGVTTLYSVDEKTYTLTEIGTCSAVPYYDMCGTYKLGQDLLAAVYGPYVLLIDTATGDMIGAFNGSSVVSGNLVGIAYYYGITNTNYNEYVNVFVLLDDEGNLYDLAIMPYQGSIRTFGFEDLGVNLGDPVDTPYWQSLYSDAVGNIFWSRFNQADNVVEMKLYDANEEDVFSVGTFADGVWPVSGLYEQNVVAPVAFDLDNASAGAGMRAPTFLMKSELQPMMTEQPTRMEATTTQPDKASNGGLNSLRNDANSAVVVNPIQLNRGETGAMTAAAEVDGSKVLLTEKVDVTNGTCSVTYDPEKLTFVEGSSDLKHYSVHDDEEGTVMVSYATTEAVKAEETIVTLTFEPKCEDSEITVTTTERNDELNLNESDDPVTVEGTGHDWGEPTWTWSDDNTTATATFVCGNDETHVYEETVKAEKKTTEATCDKDGKTVYTATVTGPDGKEYTTTKEETIPATGHDWGEPTWEWSDDKSTATATFVCKNCGEKKVVTAEVTKTTDENGKTTYTAKVTGPDGKEYTDVIGDGVKTGDPVNLGLYFTLVGISAAAALALIVARKKRNAR